MTESYKIDPDGIATLKKKVRTIMIICMLLGVLFSFSSWLFFEKETPTSGITLMISIPLTLIVFSFIFYRSNKTQMQMLDSYRLTISDQTITREQATLPDMVIERDDIKYITKTRKGVFVIQGKNFERIYIPSQIENYEQLERSLKEIKPVESHADKQLNRKLLWILISIAAIIIITAFITLHTILLYLAVTLIIGYFAWAYIYMIKSKMIPNASRSTLILVVFAFCCGYFMLMKRIYDHDQVKQFNYEKPSEDVSYLLDSTKLNYPPSNDITERMGTKADPETEWVIDLYRIDKKTFTQKGLDSLFDGAWWEDFDSNLYGHSTKQKKWMFAFSGDSLETYDSIQIGVSLLNTYNMKDTSYGPELLDRYVTGLIARIKKYPELKFKTKEFSEIGFKKAQNLVMIHNGLDKNVTIFLQSDDEFPGMKVWDVLKSIGLNLNEDYVFEWTNQRENSGAYNHFTVETSTKPGYFTPDVIEKGMNPKNLIFKFSIPRSVDPEHVFEVMMNAVWYSQKRLGGKLVNNYNEPFDIETERKAVSKWTQQLKDKGIQPGSEKALVLF